MPSIQVPKFGEAVPANVTSAGVVQVASSTPYYVGCTAYLSDTTGKNKTVLITKIVDATHIQVRALLDDGSNVNSLSYAMGSDLSAFTLANGTRIDMPAQPARVDQPTFSKVTSI